VTAGGSGDVWAVGSAYESYVGRWSRLVARDFLAWLMVPAGHRWLDVGCGTGALSQGILEHGAPSTVIGIDASAGFVEHARRHVSDPRASFRAGDAQALPFAGADFDAAVSGLVLNFVPDSARMMGEMRRVVKPGGVVAVYVWDYAGAMQLMRYFWDAATALDPAARDLDEGRRFPLCGPAPLAELARAAGLDAVETRPVDVPTVFRDFDDYWKPFLGGQGPAPGYCMTLDEERRTALREAIRAALPVRPDGGIALIARAWAVKGRAA
jgi:SAM-dependent methyltransferase